MLRTLRAHGVVLILLGALVIAVTGIVVTTAVPAQANVCGDDGIDFGDCDPGSGDDGDPDGSDGGGEPSCELEPGDNTSSTASPVW